MEKNALGWAEEMSHDAARKKLPFNQMSTQPKSQSRKRPVLFQVLFWVTFAAVLVLGTLGMQEFERDLANMERRPPHEHWSTSAYLTAQMFALNTQQLNPGALNYKLDLARWLALVLFVAAWFLIFWNQFVVLRRRLWLTWRARDHVIICGVTREGMTLLKNCRVSGHPAVLVESINTEDETSRNLMLQAGFVPGDVCDQAFLKTLQIQRASHLVLCARNDLENIRAALAAGTYMSGIQDLEAHKLTCHVMIFEQGLRQELDCMKAFPHQNENFRVEVISPHEHAARLLFEKSGFLLDGAGVGASSSLVPRLIIIGCGQMGHAVLHQAGRIGQFANGKAVEIFVIDADTSEFEAHLRHCCPEFVKHNPPVFRDISPDSATLPGVVAALCAQASGPVRIVLTLGNERLDFVAARRIYRELEKRRLSAMIATRTHSAEGLAEFLEKPDQVPAGNLGLIGFGAMQEVFSHENVLDIFRDRLAIAFHYYYTDAQKLLGHTLDDNASIQDWEELADCLKDSNRGVADHVDVKLRAVGCCQKRIPRKTDGLTKQELKDLQELKKNRVKEFEPAEIEVLARMEHDRFIAERALAGWSWTDGVKDSALKLSSASVPWEKLSHADQQKDFQQVRDLPRILYWAGFAIIRLRNGV